MTEVANEVLHRGQEYRFEVDAGARVEVSLRSGQAEVFGTELTVGPAHVFEGGAKAAVYSWQGCEIEVRGTPAVSYTSAESPMMAYLNTHFAIDRLREAAHERAAAGAADVCGPRVLLVGADDSGKTSLLRILASYAHKARRRPVLVDLDPREGLAGVPGCLSAMPLDGVLDPALGFGGSATTGATGSTPRIPLVYPFGAASPAYNVRHYRRLLARLAVAVNSRLARHPNEARDGLLVDFPGLSDRDKSGELIQAACVEFAIDTVLVLGNERLAIDLQRRYGDAATSTLPGKRAARVLKLPKSGGVVERDGEAMGALQQAQFRQYFYGATSATLGAGTRLNTFSSTVSFDDVVLWKVDDAGEASRATAAAKAMQNDSLMPIGLGDETEEVTKPTGTLSRETPSSLLVHRIVAVLARERGDQDAEDLAHAPALGFLHIRDVDDAKRKIVLGSPFQGRLPLQRPLLVTQFKFDDR